MRLAPRSVSRLGVFLLVISAVPIFCAALATDALTLKRAVELALAHSSMATAAEADEQRAYSSYLEARDQYIPALTIGSGLGKTYGYPLSLEGSAPSIVNFTAQSSLLNPSLREFVRAAKSEQLTTVLQAKDQRNQVIQDTVLAYVELSRWEQMIDKLQEQKNAALKAEQVSEQRFREGIDDASAKNRARLTTARVHLSITQAEGSIDLLRERLSGLTGLPAVAITTVAESIPPLPAVQDDVAAKAVQFNPAVQAADSHFIAEMQRARAEHRTLWPSIDFAAQYALLASFNNYENYFRPGSFQQHNVTIGIVMRFPFFNPSQHAHAQAADAEAVRSKSDAQAARNRISEETVRLQHSVEQLAAAQQVADLEYQIAESSLEAAQIRTEAGNANIHEAEDARVQASDRFNALQDANFELERGRIALLRATGELATWVGVNN